MTLLVMLFLLTDKYHPASRQNHGDAELTGVAGILCEGQRAEMLGLKTDKVAR